jgi:DNA topoisomerase-3
VSYSLPALLNLNLPLSRLVNGEFQTPRNGRKNDQAHPPIHPTAAALNLDADERRVYELVTRRFLASCHSNAEGKTTTVEADIAGEIFSASGKLLPPRRLLRGQANISGLVVIRRNYLEVYPYDKWNENALPDFQEGEQFMPDVCELKEGQTSRPNLLTEADLVGLMDKNGIGGTSSCFRARSHQLIYPGTDATIAEHISKIIEREYVKEKQEARIKYLVPSLLGIGLVEGYNEIGFERSLSKPQLRAEVSC